jgi:prophage DNA circulation protein
VVPTDATGDEAQEVLAIIDRVGPIVLSAAVQPSSSLRRAVGMLVSDKNMINLTAFAIAFRTCLDLARQSKATLVTMDRVRKAGLTEKPVSFPAVQTVLAIIRLTLATEARIISFMPFRSRGEVEEIANAVNLAFNQTTEVAADDLDQGTYMALIQLHGTVIKHLADTGRQLPRVIAYKWPMVMPALRMSHRAYTTAARYQELVAENEVVHPAFMPMEGKMLAV